MVKWNFKIAPQSQAQATKQNLGQLKLYGFYSSTFHGNVTQLCSFSPLLTGAALLSFNLLQYVRNELLGVP